MVPSGVLRGESAQLVLLPPLAALYGAVLLGVLAAPVWGFRQSTDTICSWPLMLRQKNMVPFSTNW